jgi:hypothetical protein
MNSRSPNDNWRDDGVRERLAALRRADRKLTAFGARQHRYLLGPSLTEAGVADFEERHGVTLPHEYRTFLLEVGDGGAGPYYGVYRLDGADAEEFGEPERTSGFLATPFPHTQDWNPNPHYPCPTWMDDDEHFDDCWITGSMALCHFGCGAVFRLVTTGACRGQVWFDDRGSDGGLSHAAPDFRAWHLEWLTTQETASGDRR